MEMLISIGATILSHFSSSLARLWCDQGKRTEARDFASLHGRIAHLDGSPHNTGPLCIALICFARDHPMQPPAREALLHLIAI